MLCTSLSVVEKGLNEVAAGICCLEGIKELFSLMFMAGPGGLKFPAENLLERALLHLRSSDGKGQVF